MVVRYADKYVIIADNAQYIWYEDKQQKRS